MGLINFLFKDKDKQIEEKYKAISDRFLDDDTLWFCCQHGLSVNKADYTEDELQLMKLKALEEEMQIKETNRDKLNKILNN